MSIKRLDTYTAICDWPGCGADVMDHTDYSGWGEVEHLSDTMDDWNWWCDRNGGRHYCNNHPAAWASDLEQVRNTSAPYLLIHDGDTGNPGDDGTVTLIRAACPEICSVNGAHSFDCPYREVSG